MKEAPKPPYQRIVLVCVNDRKPEEGPSCAPRGSVDIARAIKERVKAAGFKARVRVSRTLCFGLCEMGPNVAILPENLWFHAVSLADVDAILEKVRQLSEA